MDGAHPGAPGGTVAGMSPRETLVEVLVRRQPLPDAVDWTPLLDQADR